jgi:glycine C-acetyltransferase
MHDGYNLLAAPTTEAPFAPIPAAALGGVAADLVRHGGPRLLSRWDDHQAWWEARLAHGLDPYSKRTHARIAPECTGSFRDGSPAASGVNFASQDYLNLAAHPFVHAAARRAIERYGVHSAGSATAMGDTVLAAELEQRIARFLGYADCTLFPTGWAAGYGIVKTLARAGDHIIIDVLAHACLHEGARHSGAQIHSFPHLSNEAVQRRLLRIRAEEPEAGILVVTEGLFSMDSDTPDLLGLHALCREHGATLLVDVAHDLGALGPEGRGQLAAQGALGLADVVMGSFSKTFASNGGFVATNVRALKLGLRCACSPLLFSNALSPVQAAIVLAAFEVVEGAEGEARRRRLLHNSRRLRQGLSAAGFEVKGEPSAIVPVLLGDPALARLMTRYAMEAGALVNLVEAPAVSRNTNRWRLQVMADHTPAQVDRMVEIACQAREKALAHLAVL